MFDPYDPCVRLASLDAARWEDLLNSRPGGYIRSTPMVDNQHKKITGYRDLSDAEIAQMNRIKDMGKMIEDLIADIKEDAPDHDGRWLAIGVTNLQQGLMAVTRAIAKPTSF